VFLEALKTRKRRLALSARRVRFPHYFDKITRVNMLLELSFDLFECRVSHQSVRITEKHYSPWVRGRQEQLKADVRRTSETYESQQEVHAGYARKRV